MKTYFVYILRCFDGTFYVGVTNDIERRFAEHQDGFDRHCYTFLRRPLRLEHVSEFPWVEEAIAFEKKLKGWSHRKKRAFIEKKWAALQRFARTSPTRQALLEDEGCEGGAVRGAAVLDLGRRDDQ